MSNKLQTIAFLLTTLLPCGAIWYGLQVMHSAVWAFVLYHGLCLLPAIYLGRGYWSKTWLLPKKKDLALLVVASIVFSAIAVGAYEIFGHKLLSDQQTLSLLKQQGYSEEIFWPLSIYAVVVNPLFEEIYWRGVVLNKLDALNCRWRHFGIAWSSFCYAAFHYIIFSMVLFPGWAEFATLLLALYGGMLAIIYRKTGSIVTTAIAHGLLTDTAAIALICDLFRRYGAP